MISIIRNIAGVVSGYLVFAISAVLLFAFCGIDPHGDAGAGFVAALCVYGAFFAFVGGYLAKSIAVAGGMSVNVVLALIIAGFAVVSIVSSNGSHYYTQLAAILLFAPASFCGGLAARQWSNKVINV